MYGINRKNALESVFACVRTLDASVAQVHLLSPHVV
jgi:hypothetical protein